MKKRVLSLLLSLAVLLGAAGVAPMFAIAANTAAFNFNFQNSDSAYETYAGFRTIAFPSCGWMALNNVSADVIAHNVAKDLTVEVEYYWTNKSASGWLTCRANAEAGTDATSFNQTLAASAVTADKWATWKLNYPAAFLGTREDTTDLFFSFNSGSGDVCHIRAIKVYETGKPDAYVSFDPKAEATIDQTIEFPFQDTSLSFEERAADLVSRMTTEEKLTQFGSNNTAIGRLGVRHYNYWRECLHGVARMHEDAGVKSNTATSFPYSLSMGASWNPELIRQIGAATSDEARGFENEYQVGLNYFSPTINLYRDPRWGRSDECYSEDTWLTSLIGEGFVNGLQGDDETYKKVNATIKHYCANNSEFNRENGNSTMDNRTLLELYTRAFKYICLNDNPSSVMSSYNRINGVPASANRYLLTTLLRDRWNFGGFVVSDCGAVGDIYMESRHHWNPNESEIEDSAITWEELVDYVTSAGYVTEQGGVALALLAGLDLNCGSAYGSYMGRALEDGLVTIGDIDKALTRVFTSRFETGEFDPKESVPYASDEYSLANQQENAAHRQLAEDAADEGIVLLKNENNALPLDATKTNNVVLVGENVNQVILGDYSGQPSEKYTSTPNQGVTNLLKELNPNATVTCIDTFDVSSSRYFGNIGYLNITYKDGTSKKLWPSACSETYSCQVETSTNLGYVSGGGYAAYPDIDTRNIEKIEITTSGTTEQCTHGQIEVHLNAPDGMVFASVESAATSGWGDYKPHATTDIGSNGGYDNTTLYLVFKSGSAYELTAADLTAVKNADAVIACVGTVTGDSSEGRDRTSVELPRGQAAFIKEMAALNPNTVVYMQTVSMVNVEDFKDNVDAILWTSYNGQAQGNAMARTIFGTVNPSARLPFTWYAKESQLPGIADYSIRGSETSYGRTYQYFDGDVTYPFGYGLSYTNFELSDIAVDKAAVTPDDTVTVTLNVKNTGTRDGDEVVQVYAASPHANGIDRPFKELKGFAKVSVPAGETRPVTITMKVADWYFCNEETGVQEYDTGNWSVEIGLSSQDIAAAKTVALSGTLTPALQTVKLDAPAVVLYDEAASGTTNMTADLTVALTNDDFLDLSKATVAYKSNNENVATVAADGKVTAVSAGICTITVSVTYEGKTLTDSYPLVVKGTAKYTAGTLTSGSYTITGQIPTGGSLRVTKLEKGNFFFGSYEFVLGNEYGYTPDFLSFGLDVVWNYETMPTDKTYQVDIALPEGNTVTTVYAMDKLKGDVTKLPFTVKDGILTFEADGGAYYALVGSGWSEGMLGDVDDDGKITTTDARLTLQFTAEKIEASELNTSLADVDKDTKISTTDARMILQYAAEKITSFD